MKRIYIEYTRNGKWNNAIFRYWDDYYEFSFDPEVEITLFRYI